MGDSPGLGVRCVEAPGLREVVRNPDGDWCPSRGERGLRNDTGETSAKRNIKMVDKHTEVCTASLVIGKCKVKPQ